MRFCSWFSVLSHFVHVSIWITNILSLESKSCSFSGWLFSFPNENPWMNYFWRHFLRWDNTLPWCVIEKLFFSLPIDLIVTLRILKTLLSLFRVVGGLETLTEFEAIKTDKNDKPVVSDFSLRCTLSKVVRWTSDPVHLGFDA